MSCLPPSPSQSTVFSVTGALFGLCVLLTVSVAEKCSAPKPAAAISDRPSFSVTKGK